MQTEYPSLAEIVRQETDGGRLIVQFYLGVAYGDIEGFRDHHRAAAARRIDKIAPDLVKEYLHKYHNAECRDYYARSLFPMGRIEPMQTEQSEPVQRGPNAFQRRLRQHVRNETADGRNIVVFLIGVMDGTITGFKPHHRLEAARELASYITTDTPSPSTGEGWGEGDSPAVGADPRVRPLRNESIAPAIAPADAETHRGGAVRGSDIPSPSTGEGWGEGDSPAAATEPGTQEPGNTAVVPAKAEPAPYSIRGTQRGEVGSGSSPSPSTGEGWGEGDSPAAPDAVAYPPITIEELERFDFTRDHIALYNFARDEITGGIYGYDDLGPVAADEYGVHRIAPSRVVGYERAIRRPPSPWWRTALAPPPAAPHPRYGCKDRG